METRREALSHHLDQLLDVPRFADYGPNGLQVEGRDPIRRLVTGVTASLALIDAAIAADAHAILVHHGLFWRGQDGRVTGWMKQRLARLLQHDINLYAYHLPLDAHAELGNNAQLAHRLGLLPQGRFGEQSLGWLGSPPTGVTTASEPSTSPSAWTVRRCWWKAMVGPCARWPGAPEARRAGSSRPSPPGQTPT